MVGITRAKHERGGHNGADPFGYRAARDDLGRVVQLHCLEVVREEADLVRRVCDRYGAGDVSQGRLAEELRADGLTRRGRDVREGTHEPIITPAQAHLARQAAARRQWSTSGWRQPGRVYLDGLGDPTNQPGGGLRRVRVTARAPRVADPNVDVRPTVHSPSA